MRSQRLRRKAPALRCIAGSSRVRERCTSRGFAPERRDRRGLRVSSQPSAGPCVIAEEAPPKSISAAGRIQRVKTKREEARKERHRVRTSRGRCGRPPPPSPREARRPFAGRSLRRTGTRAAGAEDGRKREGSRAGGRRRRPSAAVLRLAVGDGRTAGQRGGCAPGTPGTARGAAPAAAPPAAPSSGRGDCPGCSAGLGGTDRGGRPPRRR